MHAIAQRLIEEYVAVAGHGADAAGPVLRPATNNRTGELDRSLHPGSVYHNIVRKYGLQTGISAEVNGLCAHSRAPRPPPMRCRTRPTFAEVQEWLGHSNVSTTRLKDRRKVRPEDSRTFRVRY
jgi:integrase/recombinase XerD